jgi:chloramphenicol 3-O-phosphotransferase
MRTQHVRLANNFMDFGLAVLMDTVVQDRSMLDLLLALMSPRPVRLVILALGVEVGQHRNARRGPRSGSSATATSTSKGT